MIRHSARIALGRYIASLLPPVSFMMVLVTIIMSSAELASSLIIRWTICRRLASLFWNSLEIPKKRVVASFVGNFSPVYMSRAILVRRMRHRRGWIGELLNNRAARHLVKLWGGMSRDCHALTFLEDLCPVHLDQAQVRILVLFAVTHGGQLG